MKAGTTSGIRLCRPSRTITTTTTRTTTGSSKRTENLRYLLKDFDTNIPTFFGRKFKQFAKQGTSVERRLPSRMLQWLRHLLPQHLHQPDVHGVPHLPSSITWVKSSVTADHQNISRWNIGGGGGGGGGGWKCWCAPRSRQFQMKLYLQVSLLEALKFTATGIFHFEALAGPSGDDCSKLKNPSEFL